MNTLQEGLYMKIIGLLRDLSEARKQSKAAKVASGQGLERKAGWGNYGPTGTNLITKRSMQGQLVNVPPHPVGKKSLLKGVPAPTTAQE
jgi:hypothetical protein